MFCYGGVRCPLGQVVASLGQWVLFEVFPSLRLLEMAGAYGVFRGFVDTPSAIPAWHPVYEGQLFKQELGTSCLSVYQQQERVKT